MKRSSRIELRGVRAYGRHGTAPDERNHAQAFDLDLVLEVDLDAARKSDELSDTVDYASLHRRVVDIVSTTSFKLLERLAQRLLDEALSDPRVLFASVTLAKPRLLCGATPVVTVSAERA